MASIANAFALLRSSEQTAPSKAKKKKNKPKKAATEDAAPEVAAAEASTSAVGSGTEVVDVGDAVAILEKSARTQGSNRIKLWKDWLRQANDRSPKALKYRAPDGSIIQFKELVLRSRALEITVEGCITSPLAPEETTNLQQLLAAFIPRVDPSALASAIARLSELLAEDAQSFDTVGAAQRAAHNVIATLKTAKEGSKGESAPARPATLQERLARIEREAGKQHGFLASVEKLAAADATKQRPQTSSGISKAHVDSAGELVKLYGEKFDLLQRSGSSSPDKAAKGGPSQATIKCLEELKAVINNHLKEASALEESVKGSKMSTEAKRAQAVASLRREEAVLAQQASELAGQIRLLESQLSQLRGQAAEVEDKRVRLQQRQTAALESLAASTGRKLPGLSAKHYNEELAAADQLLALVDPSHVAADKDQLAAAQAEHCNSAEQYMASVRNFLQMSSSNLADVPSRVEFCRQRIAQAEKLASLGGLGKEKSAKTYEEAQKLMSETVKAVEEVMRGAHTALEGMRARYPSFSPAQQAGLTQAAYEIEDLMAFIQRQFDMAMAAVHGHAPAPVGPGAPGGPRPAAAPVAYGPPAGALGGIGAPAAAAGAPGSLLGGGSDGAPLPPGGVRPSYGAKLGPIQPPAAAAAAAPAKGAATSNGHAAPAPAPAPVAADGFKQVSGKKGRRKA